MKVVSGLEKNLGNTDRIIRVVMALALLGLAYTRVFTGQFPPHPFSNQAGDLKGDNGYKYKA